MTGQSNAHGTILKIIILSKWRSCFSTHYMHQKHRIIPYETTAQQNTGTGHDIHVNLQWTKSKLHPLVKDSTAIETMIKYTEPWISHLKGRYTWAGTAAPSTQTFQPPPASLNCGIMQKNSFIQTFQLPRTLHLSYLWGWLFQGLPWFWQCSKLHMPLTETANRLQIHFATTG